MISKAGDASANAHQPLASMEVDGILWELLFDSEGNHHWETAAMVNVSQLAQAASHQTSGASGDTGS